MDPFNGTFLLVIMHKVEVKHFLYKWCTPVDIWSTPTKNYQPRIGLG